MTRGDVEQLGADGSVGAKPTALGRLLRRLARVPAVSRRVTALGKARGRVPVGRVRFGDLRRLTPLSRQFGYDRGTPVDRYYIERFLSRHGPDVRGHVLEVKDRVYTERFGTAVERSDVLDIDATNPRATITADLAAADAVPAESFDCIILTQTLQLIYAAEAAVCHMHRMLRPGGVLLATVPALSRLACRAERAPDYWRFTAAACSRLFGDVFGPDRIDVRAHGNVLTGIAFHLGMALEELRRDELETDDPFFPLVVTIRAVK